MLRKSHFDPADAGAHESRVERVALKDWKLKEARKQHYLNILAKDQPDWGWQWHRRLEVFAGRGRRVPPWDEQRAGGLGGSSYSRWYASKWWKEEIHNGAQSTLVQTTPREDWQMQRTWRRYWRG
ncbi:hypothetical protein MRB53_041396 [Persea americana]|nr:hypothetical protein MRB53_041396 [Persea americana]